MSGSVIHPPTRQGQDTATEHDSLEHARRLNLARELGQPFSDHRIASFRADGERTLALVDRMVRLNAAYQAAVDAEDLEAIETILVESENWAVA